MEAFVFKPSAEVGASLQKYFEDFEDEFFRPHPLTERQELSVKREIDIHASLLQNFVVTDPNVPVTRLNTLQLTVTSRAREGTRGRAKQYRASRHIMTFRRALRNWLMNKVMAEAFSVEFMEPMPEEPMLDINDLHYVPIEALEMIMRFESWTKYQVPSRAYVIYTREDRQVLAQHLTHKTEHQELGAKCIKFEEYLEMRKVPSVRAKIEDILVNHYFPAQQVNAVTNHQTLAAA